jgi:hypothetical protein
MKIGPYILGPDSGMVPDLGPKGDTRMAAKKKATKKKAAKKKAKK